VNSTGAAGVLGYAQSCPQAALNLDPAVGRAWVCVCRAGWL